MLQEIRIKNFLSFKDEVKFSFEASGDKFAEDYQVVKINDNVRLLRFAVVYGYNASGKSNLLRVFDFLSDFWSEQKDLDDETGDILFKLDNNSANEHSYFDLIFYVGSTKYCYNLELDRHSVYLEKLSYYRSTQPIMLFERKLVDNQSAITFGSSLKISNVVKEGITLWCLKNTSFFVARNKVNVSIPLIDAAKDWMKKHVMRNITPMTRLTHYAQRKLSENAELAGYIVDFLNAADFNITDINSKEVEGKIPDDVLKLMLTDDKIPDDIKRRITDDQQIKEVKTFIEHTVENENGMETYLMDLDNDEESTGTLRTLGIEAALYQALRTDSFLGIDEIETSLHPKLLEKILFEYLKSHSKSQILVTTHNDGLLDLVDDLIRKDSVWFTEKKKSGVTDLYKLTDFKGVNRLSSIREAYRNKRFGATMK